MDVSQHMLMASGNHSSSVLSIESVTESIDESDESINKERIQSNNVIYY